MTGKNIFMAKPCGSLTHDEIVELVESKKGLPPCRGYESDYERVTQDEQTDDYAGFPQIVSDAGFK